MEKHITEKYRNRFSILTRNVLSFNICPGRKDILGNFWVFGFLGILGTYAFLT